MDLLGHIVDTMKEWQLKMGRIDSDIRLYYPPDSVCEFLDLPADTSEEQLVSAVDAYLRTEAPFLGRVSVVPAKDHRVGVVISKEGNDYIADHVPAPVFLQGLLQLLKKQDLEVIRIYFADTAASQGGTVVEEQEEDGGLVLSFDRESIDPYVYCFDSDCFGVTYHRFSRSDYDKLK